MSDESSLGEIATLVTVAGGLLLAIIGVCCKSILKMQISDCSFCYGMLSMKRDDDIPPSSAVDDGSATNRSYSIRALPPSTNRAAVF
jgi:hypothetical protein